MFYVTVIWAIVAPVCLALAAIHLLVWCQNSSVCANLLVTLTAVGSIITGTGVSSAANAGTNDPSFVVKSWRTIDGLPQNSVGALAQTPDGYLWIGTRGGLARFDGVRFRTYGLADGLKSLSILALLEDGEGGLWIGTLGGGLSHWHNGLISTLTTADGLAHNDVFALALAETGGLWVGTRHGLQHLGPDGFKQIGEADNGVRSAVFAMAVSPTEGLWFNQENVGLFHYQHGRCELVEPAPKSRSLFPSSLLVDADGALWLGMGNGVVLRRHAGAWQEFNQTHGVPFSYIYCMAQAPSGEIWAGSHEGGLFTFRNGRFHAVPGTDESVRSVKVSQDGVVWVGTQTGGLTRLTRRRVTSYPVGNESRRGRIQGIVEDPPGRFWVTTFGGGLFRGPMDRLEPVLGAEDLTNNPFLNAGVKSRDGAIIFIGQRRLWRKEAGTEDLRGTVLPDNPRALCEGVDGTLWLGTWEGELKRLVEGVPQTVEHGTFPAPVAALVRGSGSDLWLTTQGAGLFRWEAGHVRRWTTAQGLPTDILLSLHRDADGTLWIGTAGGGLAWLEDGGVHVVSAKQGLGDNVISQIVDDAQGNLWLGCNRGIMRVGKRELRAVAAGETALVHPVVLDESDGMLTAECTGSYSPAGLRGQSGMLYFSTVRGVVAVDPAQFGKSANPPSVLIEQVKLDGRPTPMGSRTLPVPPGSRELEIQFTAFNYSKPEQIRFRYRLGGKDWIETGHERSVRFSELPPGGYVFEVSAVNQDGHWQEVAARLVFIVQPFFWQTVWFRVVVAMLIMCSGGGAVWWLVRARLRRAVERERMANELCESEERLTLAAEAAGFGVWMWNIPRNELWASARWRRLFGFTPEAAITLDEVFQRIHPDDREKVEHAVRGAAESGSEYAGEYRVRLPDGAERWIVGRGRTYPDSQGRTARMLGAVVDVTARKQSEQEIARQRSELAHIARVFTMSQL
ncbi:MAG: two-component regulator propeller domain-containing protein, partial [Tepidisphaeraceae bacterium]